MLISTYAVFLILISTYMHLLHLLLFKLFKELQKKVSHRAKRYVSTKLALSTRIRVRSEKSDPDPVKN